MPGRGCGSARRALADNLEEFDRGRLTLMLFHRFLGPLRRMGRQASAPFDAGEHGARLTTARPCCS